MSIDITRNADDLPVIRSVLEKNGYNISPAVGKYEALRATGEGGAVILYKNKHGFITCSGDDFDLIGAICEEAINREYMADITETESE